MEYEVNETNGQRYLEVLACEKPLGSEQDALDLVVLCWEHGLYALLIPFAALSPDFFDLKTKATGAMIQKLVNYGIKAAAVIPGSMMVAGRFREMASEANKGSHFRLYADKNGALAWLTK